MKWEELFSYCYNDSMEAKVQVRGYIVHPSKIDKLNSVASYDRSTEEMIKRMEEYIEALKGYRKALAERYADLSVMNYITRIDFTRHKNWHSKKVTYTLSLTRVYEDGHEEKQETIEYPGSKRNQAMKDFENMKRKYPGISCNVKIEKERWEK